MSTPEDRTPDDAAPLEGEGSLTSADGSLTDREPEPGAGPGGEGSLTNESDEDEPAQ
jgi:hypothetical protein